MKPLSDSAVRLLAVGMARVNAPSASAREWTGCCQYCPSRFSTRWELVEHETEHRTKGARDTAVAPYEIAKLLRSA